MWTKQLSGKGNSTMQQVNHQMSTFYKIFMRITKYVSFQNVKSSCFFFIPMLLKSKRKQCGSSSDTNLRSSPVKQLISGASPSPTAVLLALRCFGRSTRQPAQRRRRGGS